MSWCDGHPGRPKRLGQAVQGAFSLSDEGGRLEAYRQGIDSTGADSLSRSLAVTQQAESPLKSAF